MRLLPSDIEEYVESHSTPESDLLQELRRETHLKVLMPQMLSGPIQGSVLAMLVAMIRPQRILEIGTFTGYSAIWMASALPEGGKLITLDVNEELSGMVQRYIQRARLSEVITPMIGDATELIPTIDETFDLVFIDADKVSYLKYYQMIFDKVLSGGFIVADNVLWHGKVLAGKKDNQFSIKTDAKTQALIDFNRYVQQDSRVENVLLPVRDGLMIVRKQ
ncbi:MAG: O-methyltransferase [Cyclobacteriaceae bacterium]